MLFTSTNFQTVQKIFSNVLELDTKKIKKNILKMSK